MSIFLFLTKDAENEEARGIGDTNIHHINPHRCRWINAINKATRKPSHWFNIIFFKSKKMRKCTIYVWYNDLMMYIYILNMYNALLIYNLICKLRIQIIMFDISFAYLHLANAIIHRHRISRMDVRIMWNKHKKSISQMFVVLVVFIIVF